MAPSLPVPRTRGPRPARVSRWCALACVLALAACGGKRTESGQTPEAERNPLVTITGEGAVVVPAWQPPQVAIAAGQEPKVLAEAQKALDEGRLFGGERDAVPLLLELHARMPDDPRVRTLRDRVVAQLVFDGDAALASMDGDPNGLVHAHEVGEVARTTAAEDPAVRAYLTRVDRADQSVQLDHRGERELQSDRLGEGAGDRGALQYFR